jgi:alkyl sulfatase BDS1-like metallo-beta-lactamase superfamily hydrolase
VTLSRAVLNRLVLREISLVDAIAQGLVMVEGEVGKVTELFALLDEFSLMFEVVEPKRQG